MVDDLGDSQPLLVGVHRNGSGTELTGHHVTSARYFLTIGVPGILKLFYASSFYQQTHEPPRKQLAALTMMTGSQLIKVAAQLVKLLSLLSIEHCFCIDTFYKAQSCTPVAKDQFHNI